MKEKIKPVNVKVAHYDTSRRLALRVSGEVARLWPGPFRIEVIHAPEGLRVELVRHKDGYEWQPEKGNVFFIHAQTGSDRVKSPELRPWGLVAAKKVTATPERLTILLPKNRPEVKYFKKNSAANRERKYSPTILPVNPEEEEIYARTVFMAKTDSGIRLTAIGRGGDFLARGRKWTIRTADVIEGQVVFRLTQRGGRHRLSTFNGDRRLLLLKNPDSADSVPNFGPTVLEEIEVLDGGDLILRVRERLNRVGHKGHHAYDNAVKFLEAMERGTKITREQQRTTEAEGKPHEAQRAPTPDPQPLAHPPIDMGEPMVNRLKALRDLLNDEQKRAEEAGIVVQFYSKDDGTLGIKTMSDL